VCVCGHADYLLIVGHHELLWGTFNLLLRRATLESPRFLCIAS
jgi:hypothetical protein